MITSGLGLDILIQTPFSFAGDWMTFCLCYSIRKYIPDARIHLKRINQGEKNLQFFNWSSKLGITNCNNCNPIVLDCNLIMVRPIEKDAKFILQGWMW